MVMNIYAKYHNLAPNGSQIIERTHLVAAQYWSEVMMQTMESLEISNKSFEVTRTIVLTFGFKWFLRRFFYQNFIDDDRRQVMAIHVAHFGPGQLKMKALMRLIFHFGTLT
jgi:hypothetical protein